MKLRPSVIHQVRNGNLLVFIHVLHIQFPGDNVTIFLGVVDEQGV